VFERNNWSKWENSQCVFERNILGGLCEMIYHLKEFIRLLTEQIHAKWSLNPNFGNISQIFKPKLLPHFITLLCKIPWQIPKPHCYLKLRIKTTVEKRWYLTIPVETITKTRHLKIHSTKWRRCRGLWIDIASIAIVA
jgi:hypothetical protein